MNKIVNGVANDFEFETLNISNSNGNIGQLFEEKDKEIERLNNIIDELEKYCIENVKYDEVGMKILDQSYVLDKLAELKGGK